MSKRRTPRSTITTIPHYRYPKLTELVERWAEKESIQLAGKGHPLPELKYKWSNPHQGCFFRLAEGCCTERDTRPKHTMWGLVDEFGATFRKIEEINQALILLDRFETYEILRILKIFGKGEKEKRQWTSLFEILSLPDGALSAILSDAWRVLRNAWRPRYAELQRVRQQERNGSSGL